MRPWLIRTVAGGIGGPGPASQINSHANCAVTFADGSLYGTEFGLVRRISLRTGRLDTPVGTGFPDDPSTDGLLASQTGINYDCGVAVDSHGNVIFPDGTFWQDGEPFTGHDRVRVEAASGGTFYGQPMLAGHVYTIAGTGAAGYSGDGGPARSAQLDSPGGLAVDGAGNVIVSDFGNDVLRIIAAQTGTFYGQSMTAGDIYPLAGNGSEGETGDGGPATSAQIDLLPQFDGKVMDSVPWPVVAVDAHGNVVLGDVNNGAVRVIAGSDGTFYGTAMTAGDIYLISRAFSTVSGIALDHAGNILVSDLYNEQVKVIAESAGTFYGQRMTAGSIYVIAGDGNPADSGPGDGGPALKAEFAGPIGLAVDSVGNVVIADSGGWGQFYLFESELLRVVAEHTGRYYGISMKAGDIYTISGRADGNFYGDAVPATSALLYGGFDAFPNRPAGAVTTNRAGSFFITDTANERIRMVAASSGTFFGRKMVSGDIYTLAGTGVYGFTGNGGPGRSSRLRNPTGAAVDASGNLLFTDRNNYQVRIIAVKAGRFYGQAMKAGHVYTIAGSGKEGFGGDGGLATKAKLNLPYGLAVDHQGNVVITDELNGRVRVIAVRTGRFYGKAMKANHIYTVARLACAGVAVDASGNLVLSEVSFVRVVAERTGTFYGIKMRRGSVYTIAGAGRSVPLGDGGPARSANIGPAGIALDAAGNIVIADSRNMRVRVIAVKPGTFYGQAMTAEHIYTIAGTGRSVPLGDGGLATQAFVEFPSGVAVAPDGSVLLADNGRIRRVSN